MPYKIITQKSLISERAVFSGHADTKGKNKVNTDC